LAGLSETCRLWRHKFRDQARWRGVAGRKERIRRRPDLLGREKLQVATARRLGSLFRGECSTAFVSLLEAEIILVNACRRAFLLPCSAFPLRGAVRAPW